MTDSELTLSGPAPAATYAGEPLPASTTPPPFAKRTPSRRAGGGRWSSGHHPMTPATMTQLLLSDAPPAEAAHIARSLGGDPETLPVERVPALQRGCWRVLNLFLDGDWHSWDDVRRASGNMRSADRRRRQIAQALGVTFERQDRGSGDFWYRLPDPRSLPAAVVAKARAAGSAEA